MIQIYDTRLSSIKQMQELFESYCKSREVKLDFTTEEIYGSMQYVQDRTASNFEWFIRGIMAANLDDF